MTTKVCNKCNTEKSIVEFHKQKGTKDGLRGKCKHCRILESNQYYQINKDKIAEYHKKHYEINKDKIADYKKQYRQANKDKIVEKDKQYYQANKAKIAEKKKQYQQTNKDKIAEKKRQYRQANKAKIAEYQKEYQQANKTKIAEKSKNYRQNNKAKIAEKNKQYQQANKEKIKEYLQSEKGKLVNKAKNHKRRALKKTNTPVGKHFTAVDVKTKLKLQKYKCVYCKASLKKYYEVDHIIALSKGGSNEASNIQLLCKDCNGSGGKWDKDATEFAQQFGMLI